MEEYKYTPHEYDAYDLLNLGQLKMMRAIYRSTWNISLKYNDGTKSTEMFGIEKSTLVPDLNIITSCFYQTKNLVADDYVPIAICAKVPDWYKGLEYKQLAPSYDCLTQYHKDYDKEKYTKRYYEETLSKLDVFETIYDLFELAQCKPIALLCYEKPSDFCHRHLVADWINNALAKPKPKVVEYVNHIDDEDILK